MDGEIGCRVGHEAVVAGVGGAISDAADVEPTRKKLLTRSR